MKFHKSANGTHLIGVDNYVLANQTIGWVKSNWTTPSPFVNLTQWETEGSNYEYRLFSLDNSTEVYMSWKKDTTALEILFNIQDLNDLNYSYIYVLQLYKY